jgi:hypothetical protein
MVAINRAKPINTIGFALFVLQVRLRTEKIKELVNNETSST